MKTWGDVESTTRILCGRAGMSKSETDQYVSWLRTYCDAQYEWGMAEGLELGVITSRD